MKISREIVLVFSTLAIGFLLLSSYQFLSYPMLRPGSELTISQTTPIPQSTNSTIQKEVYPSTTSAVILNCTPFSGSASFQFPRFDYDSVVFNLTLESKYEETECRIFANIMYGDNLDTTLSISGVRNIILRPNMTSLKTSTDGWLVEGYIVITPEDVFIGHSLIIWANSSSPLCPVSIDLHTTQGSSLFDSSSINDLWNWDSFLTTSKNNQSSSSWRFYPHSANHTLYLNPGSLNGTCYWEDRYNPDANFTVSFSENQKVTLFVYLRVVRVDILFDTSYSIHRIIWEADYELIYDLYLPPSVNPFYVYVPPAYSLVTLTISDMFDDSSGSYYLHTLASATDRVNVNGTYNLQIFGEFSDAVTAIHYSESIYNSLGVIFFFLILLGIALWMKNFEEVENKQFRIDFRSIPSLLLIIMGFIPWYNSTLFYESFWQEEIIPIQSVYFGPIPFVGIWTEGSAFLLKIPEQGISWALESIIMFWAPILWFLIACSTPSRRTTDISMGFALFIPASYPSLAQTITANVASSPVSFSFSPLIFYLIPLGWLAFVGFMSIRGYYNHGLHSNELERDTRIRQEIKEKHPARNEQEFSIPILFDYKFYLCLLLSLLIPCAYGYEYYYSNPIPQQSGFLFPFQVLLYRWGDVGYFQVEPIAAQLIGIPYACFTAVSVVWLWEGIQHQRKMQWATIGSVISIASLIPGILVLNWIGWLRYLGSYSWNSWIALPVLSFIVLVVSLLVWFDRKKSNPSLQNVHSVDSW